MMGNDNEVMFTSAAVLDLLLQIDELKDKQVGLSETLDGDIQLQIDDSIYIIDSGNATDVQVDDFIVDQISNTTEDAYEAISEEIGGDIIQDNLVDDNVEMLENGESIEGGPIKELAKSLLLGGMIKFAKKHLM